MLGTEIVESVRKLIAPFSDPVLSELGQYIGDRIRFLRFRNSLRVLRRARTLLAESGLEPQPVPPKVLVPILEGAGLESDDDLLEAWAQLLAAAAAGRVVLPSFPRILEQLTPLDAHLLVHMRTPDGYKLSRVDELQDALQCDSVSIEISLHSMRGLGLVERGPDPYENAFEVTKLGQAFSDACSGARSGSTQGAPDSRPTATD